MNRMYIMMQCKMGSILQNSSSHRVLLLKIQGYRIALGIIECNANERKMLATFNLPRP